MYLISINSVAQNYLEKYKNSTYFLRIRALAMLYFLLIMLVIASAFFVQRFFYETEHTIEIYFAFLIFTTGLILSLLFLKIGKYYVASVLVVVFFLMTVIFLLTINMIQFSHTGNQLFIHRIMCIHYLLPAIIVIAMMFCRKRWIIITFFTLIISIFIIYGITRYGFNVSHYEFNTSVAFGFVSFLIISLVSVSTRKISDATQSKLEDYINNLEDKVESRTKALTSALAAKEALNEILFEKTQELRVLKEKAENEARTDILTGLPNRLAFKENSTLEIDRAIRCGFPLSVLMADIDHFKDINDRFGHDKGDIALQNVANMIRKSLRMYDFPARIGGEEFAIILPEADLEYAFKIAERIRSRLEKFVKVGGKPVTCSIGIGFRREKEDSIDEMLTRADAALYVAKQKGRNRVEVELFENK